MMLGELILEWKKAKGMSSRELARRLGMSHVTLHRFTKGDNIRLEEAAPLLRWALSDGVYEKAKQTH